MTIFLSCAEILNSANTDIYVQQLISLKYRNNCSCNLSYYRTEYCFSSLSYNEKKTINEENLMNFAAVAILFAIVLSHSLN